MSSPDVVLAAVSLVTALRRRPVDADDEVRLRALCESLRAELLAEGPEAAVDALVAVVDAGALVGSLLAHVSPDQVWEMTARVSPQVAGLGRKPPGWTR